MQARGVAPVGGDMLPSVAGAVGDYAQLAPGALRVLIVDSKSASRQQTAQLLRECQYQVTAVKTAREALLLLAQSSHEPEPPFDLILKEHEPPAANACRLLRKLAKVVVGSRIPLVVTSSLDERETVMGCLALGAIDFLVKPLRQNELRHIWKAVFFFRKTQHATMHNSRFGRGVGSGTFQASSSDSQETKCEDEEEPTSKEGSAPDNGNGSNGHGSNGSKEGNGTSRVEAKAHRDGHGNGNGSSGDNKNFNGNSATKHGHNGSNGNGASTTLAADRNGHPLANTAEGKLPPNLILESGPLVGGSSAHVSGGSKPFGPGGRSSAFAQYTGPSTSSRNKRVLPGSGSGPMAQEGALNGPERARAPQAADGLASISRDREPWGSGGAMAAGPAGRGDQCVLDMLAAGRGGTAGAAADGTDGSGQGGSGGQLGIGSGSASATRSKQQQAYREKMRLSTGGTGSNPATSEDGRHQSHKGSGSGRQTGSGSGDRQGFVPANGLSLGNRPFALHVQGGNGSAAGAGLSRSMGSGAWGPSGPGLPMASSRPGQAPAYPPGVHLFPSAYGAAVQLAPQLLVPLAMPLLPAGGGPGAAGGPLGGPGAANVSAGAGPAELAQIQAQVQAQAQAAYLQAYNEAMESHMQSAQRALHHHHHHHQHAPQSHGTHAHGGQGHAGSEGGLPPQSGATTELNALLLNQILASGVSLQALQAGLLSAQQQQQAAPGSAPGHHKHATHAPHSSAPAPIGQVPMPYASAPWGLPSAIRPPHAMVAAGAAAGAGTNNPAASTQAAVHEGSIHSTCTDPNNVVSTGQQPPNPRSAAAVTSLHNPAAANSVLMAMAAAGAPPGASPSITRLAAGLAAQLGQSLGPAGSGGAGAFGAHLVGMNAAAVAAAAAAVAAGRKLHVSSMPEPKRRRALALDKYRMKRQNLKFSKAIRYESRQQLAQARPRIKGQFIKGGELEVEATQLGTGSQVPGTLPAVSAEAFDADQPEAQGVETRAVSNGCTAPPGVNNTVGIAAAAAAIAGLPAAAGAPACRLGCVLPGPVAAQSDRGSGKPRERKGCAAGAAARKRARAHGAEDEHSIGHQSRHYWEEEDYDQDEEDQMDAEDDGHATDREHVRRIYAKKGRTLPLDVVRCQPGKPAGERLGESAGAAGGVLAAAHAYGHAHGMLHGHAMRSPMHGSTGLGAPRAPPATAVGGNGVGSGNGVVAGRNNGRGDGSGSGDGANGDGSPSGDGTNGEGSGNGGGPSAARGDCGSGNGGDSSGQQSNGNEEGGRSMAAAAMERAMLEGCEPATDRARCSGLRSELAGGRAEASANADVAMQGAGSRSTHGHSRSLTYQKAQGTAQALAPQQQPSGAAHGRAMAAQAWQPQGQSSPAHDCRTPAHQQHQHLLPPCQQQQDAATASAAAAAAKQQQQHVKKHQAAASAMVREPAHGQQARGDAHREHRTTPQQGHRERERAERDPERECNDAAHGTAGANNGKNGSDSGSNSPDENGGEGNGNLGSGNAPGPFGPNSLSHGQHTGHGHERR